MGTLCAPPRPGLDNTHHPDSRHSSVNVVETVFICLNFKAGNEGSRGFHNHREGSYLVLLVEGAY